MMTQTWKHWWWTFAGIVGIGGVLACWDTAAVAQITPDTTLGTENSVVTPNVDIQGLPADLIEGGATRDAALFHSFSEFNVGEGLRVYFANPVGIETIFSRVTGSDVSDILGTLGVKGGASLFLLNPNGIIFGENARLDIAGSFVGSTANAIGFGEQGIFSATEPETPSLLTINPDALFFNQLVAQETRSIEVRGSLSVPSGESLLLVGGNVAPDRTATGEVLIDGGTLEALGGRVELAAVGEPSKVELVTDSGSFGLNFPAELAGTDVSIVDSTISVRDADAGDIAIYARNLSMENSQILAGIGSGLGSLDAQAGNITINVTETMEVFGGDIQNGVRSQAIGKAGDILITVSSLSLRDGAGISTSTFGEGDAGQVVIQATDSILFDGEDSQGFGSGVYSQVTPEAKGNSERIEIDTGSLTLTNGGVINTSIFAEGDGGYVLIQARNSILFDGEDSQGIPSGIYSEVMEKAKGNSGKIEIATDYLAFTNGGVITASTFGEGDAGQVVIQATDSILFDGESRQGFPSSVFSIVGEEAKGNSGRIEIDTRSLTFTNGAVISAVTRGKGNAGRVVIRATDSILFDGEDSQGVGSGISSIVGSEAKGNSLGIEIDTGSLTLTNGAGISASTLGEGDAGRVIIRAIDSILFDGENSLGAGSGISSTVLPEAKGNSLGVEIDTGSLTLTNGAKINTFTGGEGDAGRVAIQATDSILFDGEGSLELSVSGIYSLVGAEANGNSGKIEIDTGSLILTNGALINTSIFGEGNADRVTIRVRDSIVFDGEGSLGLGSGIYSQVTEEAKGDSLGIEIETGSLILTNGSQINANTFGEVNAGRVAIRARDSIVFDGEGSLGLGSGIWNIVASDANGNSLGVEIETGSLTLTNGGVINAATLGEGNAGRVAIQARDSIVFNGESSQGIPSGIHSAVFSEAKGNSLGIEIETDALTLTNGASINAETESTGMAGDVDIHATKFIQLNQGSSIRASATASGQAGNLMVETGHLSVQDGAEVNVSSEVGQAGNLTIAADSIVLNHGTISAETAKSDAAGGANITLDDLNLLLLENESLISASALDQANGGNVTIDSTFIVALPPTGTEGSDIIANAVQGNGGRVSVTTQGLFDIAFRPQRTPLNDITVSSEFGLDGVFVENRPDIDPNRGLTELENNFVDAERLIDRSCNAGGAALASSLIFTGRGGIPPSPLDVLESDAIVSNWVSLDEDTPTQTYPEAVTSNSAKPRQIIEAQGWVKLANGQIMLVAEPPTVTPQGNWQNTTGCDSLESK